MNEKKADSGKKDTSMPLPLPPNVLAGVGDT